MNRGAESLNRNKNLRSVFFVGLIADSYKGIVIVRVVKQECRRMIEVNGFIVSLEMLYVDLIEKSIVWTTNLA